jgi:hypothetical protein
MEFHDLGVDVVLTGGTATAKGDFVCRFQRDVGPFSRGTAFRGRFRELGPEGGVITSVQIP